VASFQEATAALGESAMNFIGAYPLPETFLKRLTSTDEI
jgi:hypothetical protein